MTQNQNCDKSDNWNNDVHNVLFQYSGIQYKNCMLLHAYVNSRRSKSFKTTVAYNQIQKFKTMNSTKSMPTHEDSKQLLIENPINKKKKLQN